MIDASGFATHHIAFWADQTPTSEHFVRRLNLEHTERWEPPLFKPATEIRPAFVAELAFNRFCSAQQGVSGDNLEAKAIADTRARLRPLMDNPSSLSEPLSEAEQEQTTALEQRLSGFFRSRSAGMVTRPLFHGCGFVDASEGDVIGATTLFEIKAVDRPFRSVDVRQLLTYCALNHGSRQYEIFQIGVYNPRRGLYFAMDVDRVCHEISGTSKLELFNCITHVISSGEISR